jgi:AcrR family transcriptional regulator
MSGTEQPVMTDDVAASRQVRRTQQALLRSFAHLILERGYEALTVRDIIAHADVGRSTFYEHFDNKEQLLRLSMMPLLRVLADAVDEGGSLEALRAVLAHFWKSRRVARGMFGSGTRPIVQAFLAELIEERLATRTRGAEPPLLPLPLIASTLAEGELGLLYGWLTSRTPCDSDLIARALCAGTSAAAQALMGEHGRGARRP